MVDSISYSINDSICFFLVLAIRYLTPASNSDFLTPSITSSSDMHPVNFSTVIHFVRSEIKFFFLGLCSYVAGGLALAWTGLTLDRVDLGQG